MAQDKQAAQPPLSTGSQTQAEHFVVMLSTEKSNARIEPKR